MDVVWAVWKRESGRYLAHDFKEGLTCHVRASGGLYYVIDQDTSDRLTSSWRLMRLIACFIVPLIGAFGLTRRFHTVEFLGFCIERISP